MENIGANKWYYREELPQVRYTPGRTEITRPMITVYINRSIFNNDFRTDGRGHARAREQRRASHPMSSADAVTVCIHRRGDAYLAARHRHRVNTMMMTAYMNEPIND